ncbi:MAG: peptide-methionine (S)-S-oxide reductase MsrA [Burkholderiaceae bacterium]|nr:peptide-methionine (S)-S-oxide reductase MsrA [Burkholderiaceae bacterium]MCD8517293.1 peptide-methionine (S)-S-oxide reductase MsrA [Burkholderiaceae bacterium]MCD8537593.1 peptide-methionine (S)-S-oxide reductase MsrA [Burkholderiaceae bacterium]MCD8565991.1 peptide-methionine (S)-S-oxide reductase MsrA [Burkholderiaceae bacterium]
MAIAVFGGGCFWCTEAVFAAIDGVQTVEPGYCGGHVENPTYEQVCEKNTGHIEVVRIAFDPAVVSYETLLDVFFATHDPTTPGRQGNDVGPQYQSAIFYQDEAQFSAAKHAIHTIDASKKLDAPVCTELKPAEKFWVAEAYHHEFFERNPGQGYCQFVIAPKVQKFRSQFAERIKRGR